MSIRAKIAYEQNPELRNNLSITRKQYFQNNPEASKILSFKKKEYYLNNPSAIKRLSETHKKPVDMLNKNNVILETFDCITSAQTITGVDRSSISRVCLGKQKTAGGYIWRFHID